jgi:hypothetical protein
LLGLSPSFSICLKVLLDPEAALKCATTFSITLVQSFFDNKLRVKNEQEIVNITFARKPFRVHVDTHKSTFFLCSNTVLHCIVSCNPKIPAQMPSHTKYQYPIPKHTKNEA